MYWCQTGDISTSYSPYFTSLLTYTAYLGPIRFTLDNMEFTLNNMEFTLDNMEFTLDYMKFTLDNMEFTLDNMSPVLKVQLLVFLNVILKMLFMSFK